MALTVTAIGITASAANGTSKVIPLTVAVAVGDRIVVAIAVDNTGPTGEAPNVDISDTAGNAYVMRHDRLVDPGATSAGVYTRLYDARCLKAMTTSDTITVEVEATAAIAAAARKIVAASGSMAQFKSVSSVAVTAGLTGTVTTASMAIGEAVIGFAGVERATSLTTPDADTTNGTWSGANTGIGGTGGAAVQQVVSMQSKVVTGAATQTYNPAWTTTNADAVIGAAVYYETALPGAAYPQITGMSTKIAYDGAGTTVFMKIPAGAAIGNLAVASFTTQATVTVTTPSGWTKIYGTSPYLAIYTKIVASGEPGSDVSFAITQAYFGCAPTMYTFSNFNTSVPINVIGTENAPGYVTTSTATGPTTTLANCLAIAYCGNTDSGTVSAFSAPTGSWVDQMRLGWTNIGAATFTQAIATASTVPNAAFTASSAGNMVSIIIAVAPPGTNHTRTVNDAAIGITDANTPVKTSGTTAHTRTVNDNVGITDICTPIKPAAAGTATILTDYALIHLNSATAIDFQSPFTMMLEYQPSSVSGFHAIMGGHYQGGVWPFWNHGAPGFGLFQNNATLYTEYGVSASAATSTATGNVLATGTTVHLAIAVTPSVSSCQTLLYLNGTLIATQNASGITYPTDDFTAIMGGIQHEWAPAAGAFRSWRAWQSILTSTEINTEKNSVTAVKSGAIIAIDFSSGTAPNSGTGGAWAEGDTGTWNFTAGTGAGATAHTRTVNDNIGLLDGNFHQHKNAIADAIGLLDGNVHVHGIRVSDNVGLLDGNYHRHGNAVADIIGLLDTPTPTKSGVLARTVNDLIGLLDTPSPVKALRRVITQQTTSTFTDNFTRTDSASAIGGTWQGDTTSFGIVSNTAYSLTATTKQVWVETGGPDQEVWADIAGPAINSGHKLVVRYVDDNNYLCITPATSFATWNINKRVGGVYTNVGNIQSPFGYAGVLRVRVRDDKIQGWISNTGDTTSWSTPLTITDAVLLRGTKAGFGWDGTTPTTSLTFDNIIIYGQEIEGPVGITDTRSVRFSKLISDNIGLLDARALTQREALADILGLLDTPTPVKTTLHQATAGGDSTTTGGAAATVVVGTVTWQASAGGAFIGTGAAAATLLVAHTRTVPDAVGLLDARTLVQRKALAESIGLLDTPNVLKALTRQVNDALGITDVATRLVAYSRPLADNIGLLDAALRVVAYRRPQADAIGLLDTAARVVTFRQTVPDLIGIIDARTAIETFRRTLPDLIGITDTPNAGKLYSVTASGSLPATGGAAASIVSGPQTYNVSAAGTLVSTAGAAGTALFQPSAAGTIVSTGGAASTQVIQVSAGGSLVPSTATRYEAHISYDAHTLYDGFSVGDTGGASIRIIFGPAATGTLASTAGAAVTLTEMAAAAGALVSTAGAAATKILSGVSAGGTSTTTGGAAASIVNGPQVLAASAGGILPSTAGAAINAIYRPNATGTSTTTGGAAVTSVLRVSAGGPLPSTGGASTTKISPVTAAGASTTTGGAAASIVQGAQVYQASAGGILAGTGGAAVISTFGPTAAGTISSTGAAAIRVVLSATGSAPTLVLGAATITLLAQARAGANLVFTGGGVLSGTTLTYASGAIISFGRASATIIGSGKTTGFLVARNGEWVPAQVFTAVDGQWVEAPSIFSIKDGTWV